MWIKTENGRLVNLNAVSCLYVTKTITYAYAVVTRPNPIADNLDYMVIKTFPDKITAEKYLKKLAAKLGAEEI